MYRSYGKQTCENGLHIPQPRASPAPVWEWQCP